MSKSMDCFVRYRCISPQIREQMLRDFPGIEKIFNIDVGVATINSGYWFALNETTFGTFDANPSLYDDILYWMMDEMERLNIRHGATASKIRIALNINDSASLSEKLDVFMNRVLSKYGSMTNRNAENR